jgi:hypothetical protein
MDGLVPTIFMPGAATQLVRHKKTLYGVTLMTSEERREQRYQRRKQKRTAKRDARVGKYDDFDRVASCNALVEAYRKSRRSVTWKASVQRYGMNLLRNTLQSRAALLKGKSVAQGFIEFDIFERGKKRHIKSMHFRERCVQRSLCDNALAPVLERSLIYDNGASLEGKGIHFALNRLDAHLHRFYRKNGFSNEGYVALIDFSGYFDSIQHGPTYDLLDRAFHDKRIVNLCRQFIEPFGAQSLGIGSQISQVIAVAYPNAIDHFIKQELGIKFYGRYMDDSYLIHHNKAYLRQCLDRLIVEYAKLGIRVNPKKTQIIKLSNGFTFLKRRHFLLPTGRIVKKPCRESITRMRRKLKKFKALVEAGEMTMDAVRCSYQSWRGYISHADSYKTVQSMDELFNELFRFQIQTA